MYFIMLNITCSWWWAIHQVQSPSQWYWENPYARSQGALWDMKVPRAKCWLTSKKVTALWGHMLMVNQKGSSMELSLEACHIQLLVHRGSLKVGERVHASAGEGSQGVRSSFAWLHTIHLHPPHVLLSGYRSLLPSSSPSPTSSTCSQHRLLKY